MNSQIANIILATLKKAARACGYVAPMITVKKGALEEEALSSGVTICEVGFSTDYEYFIHCTLILRGSHGQSAIGIGTSVKGPLDSFSYLTGSKLALERAFLCAFNILNQEEFKAGLFNSGRHNRAKRGQEPPIHEVKFFEHNTWTGVEMLDPMARRPV